MFSVSKLFNKISNRARFINLALLPFLILLIPQVRELFLEHWIINMLILVVYVWHVYRVCTSQDFRNEKRTGKFNFRGTIPFLWPMMLILPWKDTNDYYDRLELVIMYFMIIGPIFLWSFVNLLLYLF